MNRTPPFDPNDKIDAALETILRASGSSMQHYEFHKTLEGMRSAMRKIMSDSYIAGSTDCHRIMRGE